MQSKSVNLNLLIPLIGIVVGSGVYFLGNTLDVNLTHGLQENFTPVLFLMVLILPVFCCFFSTHRLSSIGSVNDDVFQPGAVVAILYYFYIAIPGFHIWYHLHYYTNWVVNTGNPA